MYTHHKIFCCLVLFCLSLICSCSGKVSSDETPPLQARNTTSTARHIRINDLLYILEDGKIMIYEAGSLPLKPVNEIMIQQTDIESVFSTEDYMFVRSTYALLIFSLKNPRLPVLLNIYRHVYACMPVAVKGDYAFLIRNNAFCHQGNNRLEVINMANVLNPVEVRNYAFADPRHLAVYQDYLYVCDGKSGIRVLDISGVPELKLVHTITEQSDVRTAELHDDILIVTGVEEIAQYNCSDPGNPLLISKIPAGK